MFLAHYVSALQVLLIVVFLLVFVLCLLLLLPFPVPLPPSPILRQRKLLTPRQQWQNDGTNRLSSAKLVPSMRLDDLRLSALGGALR